ncbi:MAG: hypothetical protein KUG77_28945 [Nannocystaceae bacterium]|nr:hypothetical protein [Nannocystaceae bacterium]
MLCTATEVSKLAESCAAAGGICVFIGCEGQGRCFSDATRAAYSVRLRPGLEPYILALATKQFREAQPVRIAYTLQPGALSILRRVDQAQQG